MENNIGSYHGSADMVKADGNTLIDCLSQFDTWKADAEKEGFIPALRKAIENRRQATAAAGNGHIHCTRLIFPAGTWRLPDTIVCPQCKRPMQKSTLYRCTN